MLKVFLRKVWVVILSIFMIKNIGFIEQGAGKQVACFFNGATRRFIVCKCFYVVI